MKIENGSKYSKCWGLRWFSKTGKIWAWRLGWKFSGRKSGSARTELCSQIYRGETSGIPPENCALHADGVVCTLAIRTEKPCCVCVRGNCVPFSLIITATHWRDKVYYGLHWPKCGESRIYLHDYMVYIISGIYTFWFATHSGLYICQYVCYYVCQNIC